MAVFSGLGYATTRELLTLQSPFAHVVQTSRHLHAEPHSLHSILRDLDIRLRPYSDPSLDVLGTFAAYGRYGRVITVNEALDGTPAKPVVGMHEIGHQVEEMLRQVLEHRSPTVSAGACTGQINTASEQLAWMYGAIYTISSDFAALAVQGRMSPGDLGEHCSAPLPLVEVRLAVGTLSGEWDGDVRDAATRLQWAFSDLEQWLEYQRLSALDGVLRSA